MWQQPGEGQARLTRAAHLAIALSASVAFLASAAAVPAAAKSVSPTLGRWDGQAGPARVVFTVEQTAGHKQYVVRPVFYCGPTDASWFETSFFSFFQPDAWPITGTRDLPRSHSLFGAAPFDGSFGRDSGRFTVDASTCAGRGTHFTAHLDRAAPVIRDGSWNITVEPHDHGPIGEVTDFATRGEGSVITSDWGVYDGAFCLYFHSGLSLLVSANGRFDATASGNGLATNFVTAHIKGEFPSGGIATGTYTLTGPGCSGQPVAWNATFATPYAAPRPATGNQGLEPPTTQRHIVNYVALGDSYSAGHGVPPYDPETDVRAEGPTKDICHRSKYAYSRQLELARFVFRRSFYACSGATTDNVSSLLQYPGEGVVQLGHTAELQAADLVTISIGGNNVRFDLTLEKCTRLKGNCSKPGERDAILSQATSLEPKLEATYKELRAKVPPTAAIIVLDYPQLFPKDGLPARCAPDVNLFTRETQRFLRQAASALRATIAEAARRAGVQFVDVMPIFSGHEICGKRGGWMNHIQLRPKLSFPIPVEPSENSVHPSRAGQAGYARAIADYIHERIADHAPLTPAGLPANPAPQG